MVRFIYFNYIQAILLRYSETRLPETRENIGDI